MTYSREREVAIQAVLSASQLCMAVRQELVDFNSVSKSDNSPVTIADFSSQALICREIHENFPDDEIVGEENSSYLTRNPNVLGQVTSFVEKIYPASQKDICKWVDFGTGVGGLGRFWTLDPIDGTKGFLRNDQYAIVLSLVEDGQVKVGVVGCPTLDGGLIVVGERRVGVNTFSLDLKPLPFITNKQPTQRLIESIEATSNQALHSLIAERLGITQPPLRLDSQVKYICLARGNGSIYLRLPPENNPDFKENIWDHAAGSLIVEESGGVVTDQFGKHLDFKSGRVLVNNTGVVATLGIDHSKVLQAIKDLS